jgi:hypothetical protein
MHRYRKPGGSSAHVHLNGTGLEPPTRSKRFLLGKGSGIEDNYTCVLRRLNPHRHALYGTALRARRTGGERRLTPIKLQRLTLLRNVGGIDIVLVLFRLMTRKAFFGGILHHRPLRISAKPELKAPAARRGIFF